MRSIDAQKLDNFIKEVLAEDCCLNDITTKALGLGNLKVNAAIVAKENGVLAGINVAKKVFALVDKNIKFSSHKKDGDKFKVGDTLAKISGSVSSILSCERTALNFLSQLSGVATQTREFVDKVKPRKARIMDTRKTTPGLRLLEKYAVRVGGGYNHRYDLAEAILIKDNHIAALRRKNKHLNLGEVIKIARKSRNKNMEVEIEVTGIKEFREALNSAPDIIMLDNMSAREMKQCVALRNKSHKKTQLEVSGNVNLSNVRKLSGLGVDRISVGSLTHSPQAIDLSIEFTK
ncbi:MAG: carboxylating nicotinate-nucleotide diphosphorylase [Candidatus Omnitrophica bacterium]|nr:carboxylating nicotinate-nucleotide diphosphorylase [Candidatus Omnitrophota bacterium]MDD5352544.1 carboxylating nicotinate-nucleotide diphosphorylase [Candidatus Omnitrophota bacterium]MDD5550142.1 carboxylating nicotinate-nucleotide diphosphorylase [Candidatus Omnitrophota bacterium]